MPDRVSIKNLKIFAYHGVLPEEKRSGQYFYLDIDLYGPDREPVVQVEAPVEIERISSKLWKLHVTEIQVPVTINIS